jgi:hypothetical protein
VNLIRRLLRAFAREVDLDVLVDLAATRGVTLRGVVVDDSDNRLSAGSRETREDESTEDLQALARATLVKRCRADLVILHFATVPNRTHRLIVKTLEIVEKNLAGV